MHRTRFLDYKGVQLYIMDCTDATVEEMNQVIEACERDVLCQPENSVFTLIVAGGSAFSGETISKL